MGIESMRASRRSMRRAGAGTRASSSGEIVARCLQPGASVSGIAVEHGLNPNMVRKWIERTHKETRKLAPLLPVVLADAAKPEPTRRHTVRSASRSASARP
jgi:transposase-like protein